MEALVGADLGDVLDFGKGISKEVSNRAEDVIMEGSGTITGIERNLFATVDSGVDNVAYTANNLVNTVANTFQVPMTVVLFISMIIVYKLLQNPEPIKQLLSIFTELAERFFNITNK